MPTTHQSSTAYYLARAHKDIFEARQAAILAGLLALEEDLFQAELWLSSVQLGLVGGASAESASRIHRAYLSSRLADDRPSAP
jgi:hypothetical protein